MHIAQEFHNLKTIHDFKEFISTKFRSLFPHEQALCGIGDLKSKRVTRLINIDFPNKYIRYAVQPNQLIQSPISNAWIMRQQPIIYRHGTSTFDLDSKFTDIIKSCEIHSIASHGVFDPYSQCFSYFAFANLGSSNNDEIHAALITYIPYLHYALARILTSEDASSNVKDYVCSEDNVNINLSNKNGVVSELTPRENEILTWIATGKSNGDIAQILGISSSTVNNHIKSLFKRLDVSTRAHAVSKIANLQH